ncbi:MAG: hypothetical protein D6688_07280 [Alphaproteobacteria bacterium]|nr:MAG: hypothetical protein D6688_07280 [Alphaproteobacteria bacterium]
MELSAHAARIFLPFALGFAFWVAWSDMKYMKIFNKTVLALVGVYAVVGLLALPLDEYLWRYANLGVVLLIGFLLSSLGWVGGGDAKFAAAIAPFIAPGDATLVLYLFSAVLIAAFIIHRLARRIGAVRAMAPDWVSWEEVRKFPMGLALGGTFAIYIALASWFGA